jgi:hypothetical protein
MQGDAGNDAEEAMRGVLSTTGQQRVAARAGKAVHGKLARLCSAVCNGCGILWHGTEHAQYRADKHAAEGGHAPASGSETRADGASHKRTSSSDDAVSCFTVWRCDQKEKFHVGEPTGNQKEGGEQDQTD